LLINALLVVAVYIFAGAMYSGNGIIIAFFSSILQSAANFVLAMIFLIIRAFQPPEKTEFFLSLSGTFLLSATIAK
jgi:ABC-type nickel/cobalt efflux system permease component RcnA